MPITYSQVSIINIPFLLHLALVYDVFNKEVLFQMFIQRLIQILLEKKIMGVQCCRRQICSKGAEIRGDNSKVISNYL